MKKLISILLAASMLATLAACANKDIHQGDRETDDTKSPETTAADSNTPTEDDVEPTGNSIATVPTKAPVVWDFNEGPVAVFYGSESSEVKAALDAALDAAEVGYTDYTGEDLVEMQKAIDDGAGLLVVSLDDTSIAQSVVDLASAADIPLVFFNCSVPENVVTSYDRCALLETDEAQIGRTQGRLVGEFVAYNFDVLDVNGDGKISYVLLKDDGSDVEAASCTTYGVRTINEVLAEEDLPSLTYYDSSASGEGIDAPSGGWTSDAAQQIVSEIMANYTEDSGKLVELILVNDLDAAFGVVDALQAVGYNASGSDWFIPVFGAGNSAELTELMQTGAMTGTVAWNASSMANAVSKMIQNLYNGDSVFKGLDAEIDGTWRANVYYGIDTGE